MQLDSSMKVGFIGLGHMGRGMASRLLQAGHQLVVYNRTPEKAQVLRARGATIAETLAEACQGDAVITMVSDDAAVEAIALGPDGVVRHLPQGGLHISSSTISPEMTARLADAHAAAGQRFVAAPVLGRPEAAEMGQLFVLAAGDRPTLDLLAPIFDAIGQRTFVVSDRPSDAVLAKIGCNFLLASVIESLGEALALAQKGGLDAQRFVEIVTSTLFGAPAYKTYGALIAARRFEPTEFGASLGEKDIRLALTAAEALRVPMPIASLLRDRFLRLLARDGARLDWSAIGALPAEDAGIEPHRTGAISSGSL